MKPFFFALALVSALAAVLLVHRQLTVAFSPLLNAIQQPDARS